ncbi:hypothetical protein BBK14_03515 [Parafrankia soli]|uniref:TM2 domain-containing protein n=1 Tax=Parafrankia soli TaxID=2599596 RepID=A0A1S1Q2Q0_9ACTN|nr:MULTISPECIES: TM2 domain-containing protein [Parafrankia]OHV28240.1 hypothetical protein BBK14_03515 [Parafrankia soli]CAI7974961.1 TM2 domain-containing protein [Frankia sp. Hr75.2]SQD96619.1 TM2 domain containing protein [Parafrankia sp. Ea1.12]
MTTPGQPPSYGEGYPGQGQPGPDLSKNAGYGPPPGGYPPGQPDPGYGPPTGGFPSGQPEPGYGPPPGYPPPPGYAPGYGPPPGYPGGYGPGGFDQSAPFGRHPITGEPYSDKQKIVAGLLQIFAGCFGVGRFYLGSTGIAVAQLLTCGGLGVWALVDGVMILTGNVRDQYGRPLRD